MPRLKCNFGEFIQIIERHGFLLHRHDATSHRRYRGVVDGEVRFVDIAPHSAKDDVPTGTLQSIIRQSGLSKTLFRK